MSKHTPGPWVVYELVDGYDIRAPEAECWVVTASDPEAAWGAIGREEDACLMAAAPDLFEALDSAYQKISDELERLYHNAFPSCCGKVTVSECCGDLEQTWTAEDSQAMDFLAPIHEAMRAALAKAKGEE